MSQSRPSCTTISGTCNGNVDVDHVDTLQKDLVSQVSLVHSKLRRQFRNRRLRRTDDTRKDDKAPDWEEEWKEHTQNREVLEAYSQAMHQLATLVWEPRHHSPNDNNLHEPGQGSSVVKCRIEWVALKCQEYFISGPTRLKLLDVGSCYNPFSKYDHLFDITALDLQPAPGFEKSVHRCDFLKLEVSKIDSEPVSNPVIEYGREMIELISLPEESFDIVIFSFMLEYLPSPKQRLDSCLKAWRLLKPNGLVFILKPDSNPVTAVSSKWMKQWKVGLGYLGFKRVYYEKLEHFWGAAYSKIQGEEETKEFLNSKRFLKDVSKLSSNNVCVDANEIHKLFTIPQDYSSWKKQDSINDNDHLDIDIHEVEYLFNELPFYD